MRPVQRGCKAACGRFCPVGNRRDNVVAHVKISARLSTPCSFVRHDLTVPRPNQLDPSASIGGMDIYPVSAHLFFSIPQHRELVPRFQR